MRKIVVLILFFSISCKNYYKKDLLQRQQKNTSILIKNVSIFNGKDSLVIPAKDVVLEEGKIKAITATGKNKELYSDKNIKIINGTGKTLMPGLIDTHVHIGASGAPPWKKIKADVNYNLSAYLYAGITTIYDLGGASKSLEKLALKIENRKLLSPSLYHTHTPITIKNGHPIPLIKDFINWPLTPLVNKIVPTVKNKVHAKQLIEKYTQKDIDYVKIMYDRIPPSAPLMSFEILETLIEEAHKKGYKVFVHVGSPENAVDAIKAGADVLAHGVWRGELSAEQADIIANSKTPIIYTLSIFENVHLMNTSAFYPSKYDTILVPKAVLEPVTGKINPEHRGKLKHLNHFLEDVTEKRTHWKANFKLLNNRNATILVGTDSQQPGAYAGSSYFNEIDMLKDYGLSNYKILKGATYLPSTLFLKQPDFGQVKIGFKADLLLLNSNPLDNIDAIKQPELIIKAGQIIEKRH